jgi:hypothetical protein
MSFEQCIEVYKKGFVHTNQNKKNNKVVIFDMDETLGSFIDLAALWDVIETYKLPFSKEYKSKQDSFNALMDLYPEFLRYGIANILEYLHFKKSRGDFIGVYIYTNNQVSKCWSKMITNYLEKINKVPGLFNQIIHSFKINKRIVELHRTTHEKTPGDFIRCSVLPRNTEMCFIDNANYKEMHHDKIYYIKPKPFFHGLKTEDIIQRLMYSHILKTKNDVLFTTYFLDKNLITNYKKSRYDIYEDTFVSRKILYHIQDFFLLTTRNKNTRKKINCDNCVNCKIKTRKTRKTRN